jgi:hypothetical protein
LKIKLKGRHFDTIEVMEAELQAVLNTLTQHNFQDNNNSVALVHARTILTEEPPLVGEVSANFGG